MGRVFIKHPPSAPLAGAVAWTGCPLLPWARSSEGGGQTAPGEGQGAGRDGKGRDRSTWGRRNVSRAEPGDLEEGTDSPGAVGLLGTRAFSSKMEQCQVNWTVGHPRVGHPGGVTLEKVAPGGEVMEGNRAGGAY